MVQVFKFCLLSIWENSIEKKTLNMFWNCILAFQNHFFIPRSHSTPCHVPPPKHPPHSSVKCWHWQTYCLVQEANKILNYYKFTLSNFLSVNCHCYCHCHCHCHCHYHCQQIAGDTQHITHDTWYLTRDTWFFFWFIILALELHPHTSSNLMSPVCRILMSYFHSWLLWLLKSPLQEPSK